MWKGPSFTQSIELAKDQRELLWALRAEIAQVVEAAHSVTLELDQDACDRRINDLAVALDQLCRRAHEVGRRQVRPQDP